MWNNNLLAFACIIGFAVCTAICVVLALHERGIYPVNEVLRRFNRLPLLGKLIIGTFSVILFVRGSTKPPPTPPPIVVKDIEITHYKCDHTGLEISWRHGTNVVYGTDKFIIQRATRQIPARTGWSAFTDFDETMTTNYVNNTPFHAEDNRFKVIVRKVAN